MRWTGTTRYLRLAVCVFWQTFHLLESFDGSYVPLEVASCKLHHHFRRYRRYATADHAPISLH